MHAHNLKTFYSRTTVVQPWSLGLNKKQIAPVRSRYRLAPPSFSTQRGGVFSRPAAAPLPFRLGAFGVASARRGAQASVMERRACAGGTARGPVRGCWRHGRRADRSQPGRTPGPCAPRWVLPLNRPVSGVVLGRPVPGHPPWGSHGNESRGFLERALCGAVVVYLRGLAKPADWPVTCLVFWGI